MIAMTAGRDAELLAYMRHKIKVELETLTKVALSEKLALSRPQIDDIFLHGTGLGKKAIDCFATTYHGGDVGALYTAAAEHVKKHGAPPLKAKRSARGDLRSIVMDAPEYEANYNARVREVFETTSPDDPSSIIAWVRYLDGLVIAERAGLLKSAGGRRLKG